MTATAGEVNRLLLPERLKLACPQCGQVLQGIPFFMSATEVADRKCQKCKTGWRIVAKVLSAKPGRYVHELTWTATEGR